MGQGTAAVLSTSIRARCRCPTLRSATSRAHVRPKVIVAGNPTDNRAVYESYYTHEHLQIDRPRSAYDREIVKLRLAYLNELCAGAAVADLGCGTGSYLLPAASVAQTACGVDFSTKLLSICAERVRESGVRNVRLVLGDIQALPLGDMSVDVVFSIATLYYVPRVEVVIREIARVLRPRGRALLELGNAWSLNTLVTRSSVSGVRSYHLPIGRMLRLLAEAGLRIDEHRRFQLLPMYGGPLYLRPLVTARWKLIMGWRIGGRLMDERLSSLPLLRNLAFRHLFLCTRVS